MSIFSWGKTPDTLPDLIRNEVDKVMGEFSSNSSDEKTFRTKIASAVSGGYDNADTLHNVYADFGYPETLTFKNFWNMYRRLGIAKNVIELPVTTGWMDKPSIVGFGDEFDRMANRTKFFQRVKALDTRQRVGRYAGMFMRIRDGLSPDQPIAIKGSGEGFLVSMTPLYEGQLEVLTTDLSPASETFGMPSMYQFTSGAAGSRNEDSSGSFTIHPSRVVIAAEGADNGDIYGIPAIEASYNSLLDLRKIIGAGGEGFYKNAAQSVIFKLTDAASAKDNAGLLSRFNEKYNDFVRNRTNRGMWTPGLEPTTLDSQLIPPKEFFTIALNDVAASVQIPSTILIGQQTGRLASNEDSRHFLSMINSRRENYQTDLLTDLLDWMIKQGILKAADYEIEWDDLLALSPTEKLDSAFRMSEINQKQFMSGGDVPFTGEEIREEAGHEGEEIDDTDGEEIDDDPEPT